MIRFWRASAPAGPVPAVGFAVWVERLANLEAR